MQVNNGYQVIAFSKLMRSQRKRLGISQAELAKKIGGSRISINRYETGRVEPLFTTALAIAVELKIDLNSLKIKSPSLG